MTITAHQLRHGKQLDDISKVALAANDSDAPRIAPLLPPTWIDAETWTEAIAVGDVSGDSRTDIVAFGPRPSPNQSERQLSVYVQTAEGFFEAPITSAVSSQLPTRPEGVVVRPVFGARPNVVVWGSYWIEIYSVASDGTALPNPVTIAPEMGIRNVVIRDLNADGRPDLIVSGSTDDDSLPTRVRRYVQSGVASFTVASDADFPFTPYGAVGMLGDVDGDGEVDAIDGVSGTEFGFVYRPGFPDGTFGAAVAVLETAAEFTLVSHAFVRDVDADGRPDVVLPTANGARVRFQTAPGVYTTVQVPSSAGALLNVHHVTIGDLDGNGLADVIMWINGYDVMHVALQTAPRVLTAAGYYAVPSQGSLPSFYEDTTLIADVNEDAQPDLLVVASGLVAFYNSTGSYPVLDASVTSTAQADDVGPVAYVLWHHEITNAGPVTLADGLLIQDVQEGYELSGHSVPCAYYVTTVACVLPPVPAGSSTTIHIETATVSARSQDGTARSDVFVSVGGHPIDTAPDNNAAEASAPIRGHPENLQAAGDEVFVYESAGDAVVPVVNSPRTSSLARCMNYGFGGNNAPDDTGIAGALNGRVCTAPGQRGQSRIRIGLRDGATTSGALTRDLAFSTGGLSLPGTQRLTIVDDDGGDPKLTASDTQPFEEWPAVFSSVSIVRSRSGAETWSPNAAAIGDLNADGRNDLAVSFIDNGFRPASVLVWLQQQDGALSPTPLEWSGSFSGAIASLAIGDVIGDGTAELVVPLYTELDFLRVQNGRLELVSAVLADGWKAAVSDLNGDGYADIVLADNAIQSFDGPQYWVPNVKVFHGNAARTLDPAPYELAMPYAGRNQLVVGRFNDDPLPDIAISSGQGNFPSVSIAYQNDDETFAAPVGVWVAGPMHLDGLGFGDSVTTGDFNGDDKTDLAVGSYVRAGAPSVWIYTDLRDDDFSSPSQRLNGGPVGSLGVLDIDHDGRDDLLVDNSVFPGFPGSPMIVFMQDASRQLRYAGTLAHEGSGGHHSWIEKMAVGDLDGDGRQDAVILNHHSGIVYLAHSASASESVQITTLESGDAVAAGVRARYRIRVRNDGLRRSLEVPITWSLPVELASPQIVAAKGGCYVAAGRAQCLLPQMDPGGHVDVMLTGTFTATGTYPMPISAAGPQGLYGSSTLTATVTAATSGTGSTGGGGSSGGGGALGWLGLAALAALALSRRHRGAEQALFGSADYTLSLDGATGRVLGMAATLSPFRCSAFPRRWGGRSRMRRERSVTSSA